LEQQLLKKNFKKHNCYVAAFEEKYGEIPPGAIVMMNSGWASKYPDAARVFGSQNIHDPSTFHFPGFSIDACKFLLTHRQVTGGPS